VTAGSAAGAGAGSGEPKLGDIAAEAGLARIHLVAWRDLDDPEAGGSELHADRVASLWAQAGIQVTMRTSAVPGQPAVVERSGYRVVRRSGRYAVFPGAALSGLAGLSRLSRLSARDGLVEIWNGMPFLSPLWHRGPRSVWLHHVHGEMWQMVLSPPLLGRVGEVFERRVAPPLYRRSRIVTLSGSSRGEIVDRLGLAPERVAVVPPGVEPRFTPGGERSPRPLVLAVGRLVPVKHFDDLVGTLARLRDRQPGLVAVIAGEGYERPRLEQEVARLGATDWLRLPGRLADDELVDLYRRSWVLASASSHEGWGMTVTEAGACGTPAVVTRIVGHVDAVDDGRTGLLVDDPVELEAALDRVISDHGLRTRLGAAARERAAQLTWEATARGTLQVLAADALARRRRR
jgi:glycosyltransferase involved in cell wall biosynthesis